MADLIWWCIVVLVFYTVIPTLLMRIFGIGAYPKSIESGIALTFDDGPDPKYTPILLDLLQKHNVKATFFVLGSKAERSPELILRMHREGHLIGLHNYVHRTNGLMMPWKVRRQLEQAAEAVKKITGESPQYYRPPWGIVNAFDFFLSKRFHIVLWSLIVGDWLKKTGKDKIKKRLITQLSTGSVIVLHDSGETFGADEDAPVHMLEALDEFLIETTHRGFTFVRVDEFPAEEKKKAGAELSLGKRCLITLWMQWEKLFHLLFRVHSVEPPGELLTFRVRRFSGTPVQLQEGGWLQSGDRVIELHFDNATLLRLSLASRSTMQLAVQLIRAMEKSLPLLSKRLSERADWHDVKGLYGISMIHRGATQFGFTVDDLPKGLFLSLSKVYLKFLMYVIHPQGGKRLDTKAQLLSPKRICMSVEELKRRYPHAGAPGTQLQPSPPAPARAFDETMNQSM